MDIHTQLELAKALATLDVMEEGLPTKEALDLYRNLSRRQNSLRQRLTREGAFEQKQVTGSNVVVISGALTT